MKGLGDGICYQGGYEIQLAGERDVWGLVVDKARAWMRTLMGNGDVKALEREVLGL